MPEAVEIILSEPFDHSENDALSSSPKTGGEVSHWDSKTSHYIATTSHLVDNSSWSGYSTPSLNVSAFRYHFEVFLSDSCVFIPST